MTPDSLAAIIDFNRLYLAIATYDPKHIDELCLCHNPKMLGDFVKYHYKVSNGSIPEDIEEVVHLLVSGSVGEG